MVNMLGLAEPRRYSYLYPGINEERGQITKELKKQRWKGEDMFRLVLFFLDQALCLRNNYFIKGLITYGNQTHGIHSITPPPEAWLYREKSALIYLPKVEACCFLILAIASLLLIFPSKYCRPIT